MSDISDRIKVLVDRFSEGNVSKFASKVETSEANIRNYIAGRQPKFEILASIANKFEISSDWLLTGRGAVDTIAVVNEPQSHYGSELIPLDQQSAGLMVVPLVHKYAWGSYPMGHSDQEYIDDLPTIAFTIENRTFKGTYLAFEVKGDSMDDGTSDALVEGDKLLCREVQKHHWQSKLHINMWNFVIVHRTEGILVKRIIDHDPTSGRVVCHSLNDLYEDFELNLADIDQLFNVVQVNRVARI